MANKFSPPQTPLLLFPPGTLNYWGKPEFDGGTSRFKGHGGIASANSTDLIKQHFLDSAMSYDVSYITAQKLVGLCFRVDQGGAKAGSKQKAHSSSDAIHNAAGVSMPTAPTTMIKVWIPELWFGVVPDNMGDIEVGTHHRHIDRLPTFTSHKRDVPVPRPGQLVEVQFKDSKNLDLGGEYLGLLSDEAGIPTFQGLGSPQAAHLEKCRNLGPTTPTTPPIQNDNMAVGSIGPLLPVDLSAGMGPNFKFGNKASCRGTHRRWSSALEQYGLIADSLSHYEKFPGNGQYEAEHREATGRETIIYFPKQNVNYAVSPPEVMFFFHDIAGFSDVDFARIAKAMKKLNNQNRNYIFVVTELPWSRGLSPNQRAKSHQPFAAFGGEEAAAEEGIFADSGNWAEYEEQVMSVVRGYASGWLNEPETELSFNKTFIAVGAGGTAVSGATTETGAKPDKLIMANADHLQFQTLIGADQITKTTPDQPGAYVMKFLLVITKGISASPLTIQSVEYLKKKFVKPKSIGLLSVKGKYGLIGYPDYETIVQSAIAYLDPQIPMNHTDRFPQTIDGSDSSTSPAPYARIDATPPGGQAANTTLGDAPNTNVEPTDVIKLRKEIANYENLIKQEKANAKASLNQGAYNAISTELAANIKKYKEDIIERNKKIAKLMENTKPVSKQGNAAGCPDANIISTVSDVSPNITQKDINKSPWTPVGYKFSGEGVLII